MAQERAAGRLAGQEEGRGEAAGRQRVESGPRNNNGLYFLKVCALWSNLAPRARYFSSLNPQTTL